MSVNTNINSVVNNRRGGGGIPFKSDALVWLDGTILDDEGTKYFVDKISGKNFLITDYDFDTTWVKGFPYKSAATISAPAGDATLIAADINNFLYDSGGTPNQIPVVSLFQDIDYEHKIFTKHVVQSLDSNGVEIIEPYVKELVVYSSALSGADLTKAQSYYHVPDEVTESVIWVSKEGNDTTGNGTKELPYLTIHKANQSSGSSDYIYVKSGIYTEQYSESLQYLWLDENVTINCIGRVEVQSLNTTQVIYCVNNNQTINGMIINATNNSTQSVNLSVSNATVTHFNRCYFNGASANTKWIYTAANGDSLLKIDNCVFTDKVKGALPIYTYFTGCYIKTSLLDGLFLNSTDGGIVNIYNNKINSNHKLYGAVHLTNITVSGDVNIIGNKINAKGYGVYAGANTQSKNIIINHNTINVIWEEESTTIFSCICTDNQNWTPTIENNKISIIGEDCTDDCYCVYLLNSTTPTIQYNIFNSESKTQSKIIKIRPQSGYITGKVIFNYNTIFSNSITGVDVSIGGEDNVDGAFPNSECIGNYYSGYLRNYPTEEGTTTHAFLLSCSNNWDIKYNYISNTQLALVVKANGATYTENGIYYNTIKNCMQGIWLRAVHGIKVYGNVIYNDGLITGGVFAFNKGIYMDEDSTNPGKYCEDVNVRNCIVWNLDTEDTGNYCYGMDSHAAANGCDVDYCIAGNESMARAYNYGGVYYYKVSDAKAAGKMLNCLNSDPLFTDPDNEDFTLQSASPAIGAGETLDSAYDDGLDASTDWGDENTVPTVVTKQQGDNWDIGAYVS